MAELNFSQSERRSYAAPILGALAVLIVLAVVAWIYFPHHTADITITHIAIVPTHIEIQTGSKVVGDQTEVQDNLYVLPTLHIDDTLHDPLFLSDITATLTTADDNVLNSTAAEKNDLAAIYAGFPKVKASASDPLLRESTIPPAGHAEGMVLLSFPVTQADWNNRKSATITLTFYHQAPITIPIPKAQGIGNSN